MVPEGNNWHETPIRVRYKDTDRMGVVYYGNYLTFFEVGRAECMRDLGFSYADVEEQGHVLVVIEAGATYHANAGYDDLLKVRTRVSTVGNVRVRFDYRVLDQQKRLLVTGYTVHACINSNLKPTRLPPGLKSAIEGSAS
ncbi:MAG: acyl-CoA thioesterase [Deltaproteobacteria bacterium]|nr:acyl-CoA thioesterase [Deltaproteobacteria bacterium]